MKKFQKIHIAFVLCGFLSSCFKQDEAIEEPAVKGPCDYAVEFNFNSLYENGNTEGFIIEDWRIERTCMHVLIKAMGSDGSTWEPRLIDPLFVLDSDPPKHTLRFTLENDEEPIIEISKEYRFELVPYQDGESTSEYTFDNVGETFFYSY